MKERKICCLGRIFETADITGKLVVESLIAFTFCRKNKNHPTELSLIGHAISELPRKGSFCFNEIANNHG